MLPEKKIFEIKEELKDNNIEYAITDHMDLFYERKNLSAVVRASEDNVLPKIYENELKLMTPEENTISSTTAFTPLLVVGIY